MSPYRLYQAAASANKHTIMGCGKAVSPGQFLIERLTNGRLRSAHVGQDGGLRFFEDTTGIAATNLVVGTAYRITLTLGSAGAHIYVNNTEVASIPQNVNGWDNASAKFIGTYIDGVQSPAQGCSIN
jgi:hypothetical protein